MFIGEYHRIAHDVRLIHNLIPRLYDAGIYHLGIEFADYANQAQIDKLITAGQYDEQLAYQIMFSHWPFWGYQEYIDIFYQAWQVNQARDDDAPFFRVVGLNATSDFSYLTSEQDRSNRDVMAKVYPQGDGDTFMARVILDEFIERGHKALVYMGINHAYTRYNQPAYNEQNQHVTALVNNRAGNRVYQQIGGKAFTIYLHAPWPNGEGYNLPEVYPVDGVIDALISRLPEPLKRSGFDVPGTPFASLTSTDSMWKNGYRHFNLDMYVDGYIIQGPISGYTGVRIAPGFITEENRVEAISQSANPAYKNPNKTVEEIIRSMENSADMERRFSRFF